MVYGVAGSISLAAVLGLVLNFTNWKTLNPLLIGLSILALIFLVVAMLRRRSTPPGERYYPDITRSSKGGFFKNTLTEKMLTIILITSVFLLVFTTYITANPLEGKPYTNLSVTNSNGSVINSLNMTSGESENMTITLVNHENRNTTYRILVNSGNNVMADQTLTLQNKEKKEVIINISAGDPGTRDLEIKIYKLPDNNTIYKYLKIPLTVNELVTEQTSTESTTSETSSG